jgi:hypothetical protein
MVNTGLSIHTKINTTGQTCYRREAGRPAFKMLKLAWGHKPMHPPSVGSLKTFLPGASSCCWLTPAGEHSMTRFDITRGGLGFFGAAGKGGKLVTRGTGGFAEALEEVEKPHLEEGSWGN